MTFDLATILRSKREFRQRLAARTIAETLAMLDALRKRTLALRPARPAPEEAILRKQPPSRVQGEKTECGRSSRREEARIERAEGPADNSPGQAK
jgi:hypothetical protein